MAKPIEEQIKKDAAGSGVDPETAATIYRIEGAKEEAPVPFSPPSPPQPAGPTAEQHAWMQRNPHYQRASHHFGRMINRGTLHSDGTFVAETKHPVMDGPACFGVGIPVGR